MSVVTACYLAWNFCVFSCVPKGILGLMCPSTFFSACIFECVYGVSVHALNGVTHGGSRDDAINKAMHLFYGKNILVFR